MPVYPAYQPLVPYADRTFAAAYFAQKVGAEKFTTATPEAQNAALCHATRHMNTLAYSGLKIDIESEYEFPRNDSNTIPYEVSCACCEEALAVLQGNILEKMQKDGVGLSGETIGDVQKQYKTSRMNAVLGENRGFLSPVSLRLMSLWMRDDDTFIMDRVC